MFFLTLKIYLIIGFVFWLIKSRDRAGSFSCFLSVLIFWPVILIGDVLDLGDD